MRVPQDFHNGMPTLFKNENKLRDLGGALGRRRTVTISRVKFPWPPFFRIFIFFDEVFNFVCGTTYLMRDDGATVVNVRP